MCVGERAEGDSEEAASALDDAERALETMRLLGAELEDEAGDAEAGSESGSFEEAFAEWKAYPARREFRKLIYSVWKQWRFW